MALVTKTIVGRWLSSVQPSNPMLQNPSRGKVIFTLSNPITDSLGNVMVSPAPVTANLDFNGSVTVRLYVTDVVGLNQPQTYYRVTEEIAGAQRRTYNIQITADLEDPTDLADLAPFAVSPAASSSVLVSTLNKHINGTLNVHGIADTSQLETLTGAQNKANSAAASARAYADSLIGVGNQARPGNTFTYTQPVPAATWTVTHNLNSYPSVSVVDSAGNLVEGGIRYISNKILEVTFSSAFSGAAYLN